MSDGLRLFVGVGVPAEAVASFQRHLRLRTPELEDARWVDPSGAHLTLKFLGRVDASLRGDIQGACATVAGVFPPVLLYFAGFGAFPSPARARVVWVGVLDPSSAVATLASALDGALVGLGLQAETKPYRAHVTLARLGSPRRLEVDLSPPPATEEFEMSSITLFRSHVSSRGARYESLGRYELLG